MSVSLMRRRILLRAWWASIFSGMVGGILAILFVSPAFFILIPVSSLVFASIVFVVGFVPLLLFFSQESKVFQVWPLLVIGGGEGAIVGGLLIISLDWGSRAFTISEVFSVDVIGSIFLGWIMGQIAAICFWMRGGASPVEEVASGEELRKSSEDV